MNESESESSSSSSSRASSPTGNEGNGVKAQPTSSTPSQTVPTLPRLKLTLPPLSRLTATKSTTSPGAGPPNKKRRKEKFNAFQSPLDSPAPKIPRPVKLKPLKEVLARLITAIKKKDDYAFFLQPVDLTLVPNYADVIKQPMDFGTMTTKVERGRYRSLEEFKADFMLVTTNSRTFNPPGTIYHIEAARLEAWGLEQISKASSQVIEYETDWNIDVVADELPTPSRTSVGVGDERMDVDAPATKQDPDDSQPLRSARSQSVVSNAPGLSDKSRRAPKGTQKKTVAQVSESIDPEGRLPGSKDGFGAFPAGSDMAALALLLKLKGKKPKTKKERLRLEREGPPCLADGSLDFRRLEEPFSALQYLLPEPPSKPELIPLLVAQPLFAQILQTPSTPVQPSNAPTPEREASAAPNIPPLRFAPSAVSLDCLPVLFPENLPKPSSAQKKRRHWDVIRNPPRTRHREGEDSGDLETESQLRKRKLMEGTDYGPYDTLLSSMAAELGMSAKQASSYFGTEANLLNIVRNSLHTRLRSSSVPSDGNGRQIDRVMRAEEYLIDVVYGGIDGLAYVRSLAEFTRQPDASENSDISETSSGALEPGEDTLGMSLAQWVETRIVDGATSGYHSLLRQSSQALLHPSSIAEPLGGGLDCIAKENPELQNQFNTLMEIADPAKKIEMSALILAPHELFMAETEWAGASYKALKEKEKEAMENDMAKRNAAEFLAYAIESHRLGEAQVTQQSNVAAGDTAEVIGYALQVGADALLEMNKQGPVGMEGEELKRDMDSEEEAMRRIRLNLLAIAKRAPLDKIAKIPPELVPAHIRHIVPTLDS